MFEQNNVSGEKILIIGNSHAVSFFMFLEQNQKLLLQNDNPSFSCFCDPSFPLIKKVVNIKIDDRRIELNSREQTTTDLICGPEDNDFSLDDFDEIWIVGVGMPAIKKENESSLFGYALATICVADTEWQRISQSVMEEIIRKNIIFRYYGFLESLNSVYEGRIRIFPAPPPSRNIKSETPLHDVYGNNLELFVRTYSQAIKSLLLEFNDEWKEVIFHFYPRDWLYLPSEFELAVDPWHANVASVGVLAGNLLNLGDT